MFLFNDSGFVDNNVTLLIDGVVSNDRYEVNKLKKIANLMMKDSYFFPL